jgi:hypothetical protein
MHLAFQAHARGVRQVNIGEFGQPRTQVRHGSSQSGSAVAAWVGQPRFDGFRTDHSTVRLQFSNYIVPKGANVGNVPRGR